MKPEIEKVAIKWTLYLHFSFHSMPCKILFVCNFFFFLHFDLLVFDPWLKNHTLIFFWNTLRSQTFWTSIVTITPMNWRGSRPDQILRGNYADTSKWEIYQEFRTHRKLISAFRKHILLKSNFVILQSENNFRTSSSVNTWMSFFLWTLQFNSWCLIVCHFFFDLKSQ